jgi:D-glycero-alpha-D-manno-heptose 1-phosphate guanylyltransferase
MEAIILAGGKGTRLRSLVSDRPKPLADVRGRPFLEYLMDFLLRQGCTHFILSIGYKKNMIRSHFGNAYKGITISYAEEDEPLGTGGAVLKAHGRLTTQRPFLIVNGDTFFNIKIKNFEHFFKTTNADLCIALFKTRESHRYGLIELDDDQRVIDLDDKKANIGQFANGGFFIAQYKIMTYFKQELTSFSFENDFLPEIRKNGCKITGMNFVDEFIDIGLPDDYRKFCQSPI